MKSLNRSTSRILGAVVGVAALVAVILGVRATATSTGSATGVAIPAFDVSADPATSPATSAPTSSARSRSTTSSVGSTAASVAPRHSTGPSTATQGSIETVVLAGGCFWGVQGVFQHVKGVTRAESGYDGGTADTATYDTVSTGTTGHAESVRVTFDPNQVSYGQILQIFFSVVHDPTELNRQGPDTGTQYRSVIFAQNDGQRHVAAAYIDQLTKKGVYPKPIVTKIELDTDFYPAEKYHQDYLNSNPADPYIAMNDMPKVHDLQRLFPHLYRDSPVLVLAAHG